MKLKPNNDWLAALESCMAMDSPGPEWKTREQLQEELALTKHQAYTFVQRLIELNRAEVKMFNIKLNKLRRQTPHYRLLK